MGKALLINLTQTEIESLFPADLEPHSPNTLTTRKDLIDELDKVREVGYSTDIEENELGIRCVGAPIYDLDGGVIGAISLSGLAQDINSERILDLGNRVSKVARDISQRMGWRPVARIIEEPVVNTA
jgi:DNA-binding IclR family transcriptional regulator